MNLSRSGFVASAALAAVGAATAIPKVAAAAGQTLEATMYGSHLGIKGPDGKPHDVMIPTNFVVKAGVPFTMTVTNYDEGPHTITAPEMGLNAQIKPGNEVSKDNIVPVKTTFTFTAQKKGVYRWYCALPCDEGHGAWDMQTGYGGPDKEGFMAGYFVVQ